MNLDQAIRAGGDLWMDGWNSNGAFTFETSSNTFQQALRNASKHILYMFTRCFGKKGLFPFLSMGSHSSKLRNRRTKMIILPMPMALLSMRISTSF